MASYYKPLFVILPLIICSLISGVESYNNSGITVDLIHRDSPLSPSHDPSKTHFDRLRSAIERSFSRKSALLLRSRQGQHAKAPLTGGGGAYLMEYKLGMPPVKQLSIADTGSDLTWIQCKPCTECYKQDFPYFNPSATKTYRPLSCKSNPCTALPNTGCAGDRNHCQYRVQYGDKSYSKGVLAAETLTLGSTSFPHFVFGCGSNNAGTFKSSGSGIFGLGNGAVSFVNQKSDAVNGRFSYCLTSLNATVPSRLSFGSDAIVEGPKVLSTPLVSKDPATFYYLTLKGLSVGKKRIEYNSSPEAAAEEGNIIIDSGTTLTFVPSDLYQGLESSLKRAIKGKEVVNSSKTFSLCYQTPITPPPVTAHFQGADLVLPQRSIFVEIQKGVACLAIVPSRNLAIFGNLHQTGYLIGYDLVKKQVNFLKTDCTKAR